MGSTPHTHQRLCQIASIKQTNHRNAPMKTVIEKDSPFIPLLVLAVVCFIVFAGVLGLAYIGGVFTGKSEVIANDKRIANQASQQMPVK
jgi:hypothetical protein